MSRLDRLYDAMMSADAEQRDAARGRFWKAVRAEFSDTLRRFDDIDRDDLAHDGVELLMGKIDEFDRSRGPDAMLRWVRAMAKFIGLSWERLPRERRAILSRHRQHLEPSPFARLVSLVWLSESQDWLDDAILQLSSPERRVVADMLNDADVMSIAEREGIVASTVHARKARVLAKLRAQSGS